MPRKARDERMDSRAVRLRLAPRAEPNWRVIQEGRSIGYRRLPSGKAGTWIARIHEAEHGRLQYALGAADDLIDADGHDTVTFAQAQKAAHEWFTAIFTGSRPTAVEPITVAEAITQYVDDYKARGGKALASMQATIDAHIVAGLGKREVASLTSAEIKRWHGALAKAPARLRSAANATKVSGRVATDADAERARRSSANRILTVLKAVLN